MRIVKEHELHIKKLATTALYVAKVPVSKGPRNMQFSHDLYSKGRQSDLQFFFYINKRFRYLLCILQILM
jgi:hypothetical protein